MFRSVSCNWVLHSSFETNKRCFVHICTESVIHHLRKIQLIQKVGQPHKMNVPTKSWVWKRTMFWKDGPLRIKLTYLTCKKLSVLMMILIQTNNFINDTFFYDEKSSLVKITIYISHIFTINIIITCFFFFFFLNS